MHARPATAAKRSTGNRRVTTTLLLTILSVLAIVTTAFAQSPIPIEPGPGGPVAVSRVAGPTRIHTAVAISQRAFRDGSAVAYLANADVTVDAVTGGALTDGPILLVAACDLPEVVADELARLRPAEVVALGGPAAVCDEVLFHASTAAAGSQSPGSEEPGEPAEVTVTATAEILEPSNTPPFTVSADDIGLVYEGGTFSHDITFTTTQDRSVTLNDPRFSGVLSGGDAGRMVVAGRGCAPDMTEDAGDPVIICTDDLLLVTASPGSPATTTVRLYTDNEQVGDVPLRPGTYVLDQPIRWDDSSDGEVMFDEGSATVRVTYTVTAPEDADAVRAGRAVVTWETADGTFQTRGHSVADLERIREGAASGTHIGIPNGRVQTGDGGVNTGHDWHVTGVELADVTVEVCDGTARYVDENLADYLRLGHYCPWSAVPVAVQG